MKKGRRRRCKVVLEHLLFLPTISISFDARKERQEQARKLLEANTEDTEEKCDFHVHYHAKTPTQKKKMTCLKVSVIIVLMIKKGKVGEKN